MRQTQLDENELINKLNKDRKQTKYGKEAGTHDRGLDSCPEDAFASRRLLFTEADQKHRIEISLSPDELSILPNTFSYL